MVCFRAIWEDVTRSAPDRLPELGALRRLPLRERLRRAPRPVPRRTEMLEDPQSIVMMGRPPTRVDILKSIDGVRFETTPRQARLRSDRGAAHRGSEPTPRQGRLGGRER